MTDLAHWADETNLLEEWDDRARRAARHIPPGSAVLDLGCGRMALESHLPKGCTYIPADLVRRDERTMLCELNRGRYPDVGEVTHIAALGVLEYIGDLGALFEWMASKRARVICAYVAARPFGALERRIGKGWINHYEIRDLVAIAEGAGFDLAGIEHMPAANVLFLFDPPAQ